MPNNNSIYFYNGDAYDEDFSGYTGYHNKLVAQSLTILKGAKLNTDGLDNASNIFPYGLGFGDGIIDNEYYGMSYSSLISSFSFLSTNKDIYDFLQNKHSSSITNNRYYFPDTFDVYYFASNGVPLSNGELNETNAGNPPGDRRAIITTGPFQFDSNNEQEIDIALVSGRDYSSSGNINAPVQILYNNIDKITQYYRTNQTPCNQVFNVSVNNLLKNTDLIEIYPNPANEFVNVVFKNPSKNIKVQLISLEGKIIYTHINNELTTGFKLDLSDYSSGIYFVKITGEDLNFIHKIVKN
jgi:hypothetical protein